MLGILGGFLFPPLSPTSCAWASTAPTYTSSSQFLCSRPLCPHRRSATNHGIPELTWILPRRICSLTKTKLGFGFVPNHEFLCTSLFSPSSTCSLSLTHALECRSKDGVVCIACDTHGLGVRDCERSNGLSVIPQESARHRAKSVSAVLRGGVG